MAQLKNYYVSYTAKLEYEISVNVEATSEEQAKAKAEILREFDLTVVAKYPDKVDIYPDSGCDFELNEVIED